jgi:hypothetical protein
MANEIYHRSNWGNAVNDKYWADVYEKYSATNKMFVRSDYYENSNETDKLMADIYPKPSILLTPTAYDNGSLHSVKPVQYSNIIPNSNDASNWTATNNATIVNENGNIKLTDNVGSFGYAYIAVNVELGKKYEITYNLVDVGTSTSNYVRIGNSPNGTDYYAENKFTNTGKRTLTITPYQTTIYITIISGLGVGNYAYWNDITVRETADFDFTRGSSATRVNEQGLIEDVQILSGNLVQNGDFSQIGSEEVTNGDFATDSDWVKGTGWSISGGVATCNGTNENLLQSNVGNANKNYKIVFSISNYISGSVRPAFVGRYSQSIDYNANGTYIAYISSLSDLRFVFYSNSFTGSIDNVSIKEVGQNWTFLGDFETDGTKAFITNASQYSQLTNQIGVDYLLSGNKYRLTFDIPTLSISGAFAYRYTGGSVTPILTTDIQNGKFTTEFIMPSNGYFWLQTTGSYTGLNVELDNISVIEITEDTDLPRIDYTDGTGSLLLEPQSTNLVIDSSGGSYGNNPASEILTTAPDGTNTAVRPVPDSTSDRYQYSVAGGSYATDSKLTYAWYRKRISTPSDTSFVGDLEIKALVNCTQVGSTTQIQTNVNGFDRFEAVFNIVDGSLETLIRGYFGKSIGVGNSSIAYWGHQVEALSFATSYIPTSGSTVTRLADVCNNAGSSDLINSTEGVLYAEIAALGNQGTAREITINDGTTNNRVIISYNVYNQIRINYRNSSSNIFDQLINSTITDFHKIAVKWKVNDFSFYLDGNEIASSSSGSVIPANTLTTLSFDDGGGGYNFEGKVKTVAVFKEALTDEQLQKLTQV